MAKKLAMVFGIVFIVIGLLAFISNPIVGADGFFKTNLMHDLVHIVSGIIFLIVAGKGEKASSMVLTVFGVVYLLVAILGFMSADDGNVLGLVINGADNVLHLVLAVIFLFVGFTSKSKMPVQTM